MRSATYNTPTQLQELGVAPNLGTVMLERGWRSYRDRESKKYLLRVIWGMTAAKAIPRPGDAPKITDGASQMLMGSMLGQDRSTMNRDIALFAGEDAQIVQLLNKWRPAIGCVNRYSNLKKGDERPPTKENVLKQHDPADLARLYGDQHFDPEMKGASGSGEVALWTYDENIPKPLRCVCRKGQMKFNFVSNCMKCGGKGYTLDPERKIGANARIVLSELQLQGIVKFGYRDLTCAKIGELVGMCDGTVSEALDEWEDLKVLQIVPGKVIWDRSGAVVFRYPQRIIWLPGLLLDLEIVQKERERFAAHLAATIERANLNGWAGARTHLARIAALHEELLKRWYMSRHSLGAFWNAMRTLIYREGIPCGYRTRAGVGWEHDYRAYLFPFRLRE